MRSFAVAALVLVVVTVVGASVGSTVTTVTGLALLLVLTCGLVMVVQNGLHQRLVSVSEGHDRLTSAVAALAPALRASEARLAESVSALRADVATTVHATRSSLDELGAGLDQVRGSSAAAETAMASLLDRTAAHTEALNKLETTKARIWDLRMLEASLLSESQALFQLVERFRPSAPLPAVAGWAMDPSGLFWLTDHIAKSKVSTVVECGSGTSTLWIALALRAAGHGGKLISLEHQGDYARRTEELLEAHGLSDVVDVKVAPLTEVETPRGTFSWYSVDPGELPAIDLLLVDGPPKSTGEHARYPALAVLRDALAPGATIVADDAGRADEREIIELWRSDEPRLAEPHLPTRSIAVLTWPRVRTPGSGEER